MMLPNQSYLFSGIVVTLYFFFLFPFVLRTLASPNLHHCRHDQRDALLEFKHEFRVNEYDFTYNEMSTWNKSSDCCAWDAVTCDAKYGKVISLYLDTIDLNNTLKPNSALFKLQYLQKLTIFGCYLYGEIPPSFGNLSHLTMLDLSLNALVGQVPASIGNLTQLRYLHLRINQLSGKVSVSFVNLTKLIHLDLISNYFEPELLPDMSRFHNLEGFWGGNFFGPFPTSLFTIPSLQSVDLRGNKFTGPIDFGNMSLSTRLQFVNLAKNKFDGPIPESISKFLNLRELDLRNNFFSGFFPTSLFTIPSLRLVDLGENNFTGPIDFGNISLSSRLQELCLDDNKFDGPIPESISKFLNLEELHLRNNLFSGPFPAPILTIPSLKWVTLARNQLKGPIDFGSISSSSSLSILDLSENKFEGEIPESISKFLNLRDLDLSNNKLEGKVPGCLWRMDLLTLSHNSFSSFGKSSEVLHPTQMKELRIDSNLFHGPFPQWICEEGGELEILDLSNNGFSGSINPCLWNFTRLLLVLNLRNNKFSGILPDVFVNATNLRELDVSRNRFEGKLPKTLINCLAMEFLNVEENKFKDKFPSWLGSLSILSVLSLRSNQFYGPLYHRHISIGFQNLKVIDVSHNDFTGTLPAFYFSSWSEMRRVTTVNPDIEDIYMGYHVGEISSRSYDSSMEMVHKGVDTKFEKIRKDFTSIDFSRNKFYGKIPESIGLLKELRLLNLSGNAFTSDIPKSLANLTILEALDLSQNQLSGQIPRDLGTLNFLSTINFSYNNLEGHIPQGTQFHRQNCSSFMGNPGLNGLEEICEKTHVSNPTPQESEEVSEPEENIINWIAAAIAYGPGVFCGIVIGHIFSSHKLEWFMEKFRRNKPIIVITSAR